MGNLQNVDAKELGEVIDMIKDLEEAIYYKTITEAMEESSKDKHRETHYYHAPILERDIDRSYGKMYYPMDTYAMSNGNSRGYIMPEYDYNRYYQGGSMSSYAQGGNNSGSSNNGSNSGGNGSRNYTERDYMLMRDSREGRSPMSRKTYVESKELHHDKAVQMKELDKYMQELTQDIVDMIKDASPEEKQLLKQKISVLSTKIE